MDRGIDRYSLDHGIDSITRTSRPETPLPDAAHLPPSGQLSRPELDKLLLRPNLQDYVIGQLQPEIRGPRTALSRCLRTNTARRRADAARTCRGARRKQ